MELILSLPSRHVLLKEDPFTRSSVASRPRVAEEEEEFNNVADISQEYIGRKSVFERESKCIFKL